VTHTHSKIECPIFTCMFKQFNRIGTNITIGKKICKDHALTFQLFKWSSLGCLAVLLALPFPACPSCYNWHDSVYPLKQSIICITGEQTLVMDLKCYRLLWYWNSNGFLKVRLLKFWKTGNLSCFVECVVFACKQRPKGS
jgi:hypothetical protein